MVLLGLLQQLLLLLGCLVLLRSLPAVLGTAGAAGLRQRRQQRQQSMVVGWLPQVGRFCVLSLHVMLLSKCLQPSPAAAANLI
jgi:hypothetical protein